MDLKNVVLVDGVRSAFARGGRGALVATRLDDAGAKVLRALLERNPKVKPAMIEDIGLDLSRALLGGFELRWNRTFVPDEPVVIETRLADVSTKGNLQFGVVETKSSTPEGEESQTQTTTFIERQPRD